ncbi:hypothetical protein [Methylocystis sp. B8]|uniref:hypothetical protein n=1 Tax=Methylocystis sp. B8 TaxID=544938 RepID=UPI0010FDCF29|nr:hypothetical protein [Methylocystis sp. B8]TLG75157.1 hypothetical protein FEV16_11655 [Methylocystis sp. B8]
MTPAAAIRDEAARLRLQADRLDALADALDGAPIAPAEPTWIPTGRAQQILRVNSESTIYRMIERHPEIARRAANGRNWQIDKAKLLALLDRGRGENGERSGESGECLLLESPR